MNIDAFLDRKYDAINYNCGHFVAEVYRELTGENIDQICKAFRQGLSGNFVSLIRTKTKLNIPETPCIAIMRIENCVPHAGIYLAGSILHLDTSGPKLQSLSLISAVYKISYYK